MDIRFFCPSIPLISYLVGYRPIYSFSRKPSELCHFISGEFIPFLRPDPPQEIRIFCVAVQCSENYPAKHIPVVIEFDSCREFGRGLTTVREQNHFRVAFSCPFHESYHAVRHNLVHLLETCGVLPDWGEAVFILYSIGDLALRTRIGEKCIPIACLYVQTVFTVRGFPVFTINRVVVNPYPSIMTASVTVLP